MLSKGILYIYSTRPPEHFHISHGAHTRPEPALLHDTDHSILFPLAGEVIKNTLERFSVPAVPAVPNARRNACKRL